ncbi:hypothetical protein BKA56DRAFT_631598 [Ilyonectria sp. MPI-CAGE-AT-0026]|nr:hypothetical protein BKA56DRAFT_631598 [Ilyonectria sp. MPI-CAGE-AT-0026]
MPTPIKVAIVGATGRIGSSVVSGLLNSKNPEYEITALIRPASLEKASSAVLRQRGVKTVPANLQGSQEHLVSALTDQDVVICILPPDSTLDQIPLADATLKAGVKRFVPNAWATSSPPKGVMLIRDWVMIPRIGSEKLNHVALYSTSFFVDQGLAPCATTHIDDVGRFVARIIGDSRTINSLVFAYGEITNQKDVVQLVERLSGEKAEIMAVTSEQVQKAVESHELELWPQVILEYAYNAWARGDNCPEKAKFLGYLDAKDLWPDLKAQTLEATIKEALANPQPNPGFGNDEKCASIAKALRNWE